MVRLIIAVAAIMLTAGPALADIRVDTAGKLGRAIKSAKQGDVIILEPGSYAVADLKIPKTVTLIGEGRVVLTPKSAVAKGLLNPLPGASLRVKNIVFRGATSPDKNGAGIRHDGANLFIADCRFEDNENGVLATGDPAGLIQISRSDFLRSGYGDGQSHGIYVVRAAQLEIRDSNFIGTRIGHHVKSLADVTFIEGTTLDDADGQTSYSVDASKGGDVTIANSTLIQSADSENWAFVNYDTSRGGQALSLRITGNRIVNKRESAVFLRNDTELKPDVFDNEVVNEGRARMTYKESR
ncbi:MAG: right-handed parallel beta-helix repeat-containing protein [Pseudomonadota bacterium]